VEIARAPDAERLRHALVDQLAAERSIRTARVEAALRAVPRHLFVPSVPLQRAYANDVVQTKLDDRSAPISAASQPSIVARMLEQLNVQSGDRVLEIGAGTGYNAALLAHLAGPRGEITTIDVDADIVEGAQAALTAAACPDVAVVEGDGALGYPDHAPYDRIIATVGAWDLPHAWLDQLEPAGRLVVPLRLRGSVTRSIAFERAPDSDGDPRWHSVSTEMCSFMPLRGGIADDPRRDIPLVPDGSVTLAVHQDQHVDELALKDVLNHPRAYEWTGITFASAPEESAEWLAVWLTCALHHPLCRMTVRRRAIDSGAVAPVFTWGSMATVQGGSLAYLTSRPVGDGRREVGVAGHGPHGATLAREVTAQARTWNGHYRSATASFTLQPVTATGPKTSYFTLRTPHAWLAIDWQ
jgi:protein-L-isoaspartate(D-aspartate) O-methyltransferase